MRVIVLTIACLLSSAAYAQGAPKGCLATAGYKFAWQLVAQCEAIVDARHMYVNPCGTTYTCDSMLDYVRQQCRNEAVWLTQHDPLPPPDSSLWTDPVPADHEILRGELAFCRDYFEVVG